MAARKRSKAAPKKKKKMRRTGAWKDFWNRYCTM